MAQYAALHSPWTEKPNDMLQWMMEEAKGNERAIHYLSQRLLAINFAAVHTSSLVRHCFFHFIICSRHCLQRV
jgi:hypothetical protein